MLQPGKPDVWLSNMCRRSAPPHSVAYPLSFWCWGLCSPTIGSFFRLHASSAVQGPFARPPLANRVADLMSQTAGRPSWLSQCTRACAPRSGGCRRT